MSLRPAPNRLPRFFSAAFCTVVALLTAPLASAADFLAPAELAGAKLAKYWQLDLSLAPGQSLRRTFLVDDQIYACTNDGYVFAIHAQTGALRWINPVASPAYPIQRPSHVGKQVAFVLPSEIQIYDRVTGDPVQKRALGFPAGGGAISDGQRLYFGGLDRRFYALRTDNLFTTWRVLTEGQITSAPVLFGDYVYFASEDGKVYACNRENKKFQWKYSTYGPITADLVVTEDGVYAASRDNSLYLLDILFGQVRWRARLGGPLIDSPAVIGSTAYQYSARDGLVAIDAQVLEADDRVLWTLKEGRAALTADEQNAYVLTTDDKVAVVDRKSGEVKQRINAPGFNLAMPDAAMQSLFLASSDGRLFCARSLDAPYIRAADVRVALQPTPPKAEGDAAASQPASQPADGEGSAPVAGEPPALPDRPELPPPSGPAVGGRSKVSRGFGRPGGGQ